MTDQTAFDVVSSRALELARELSALEEVMAQLRVDIAAARDRLAAEEDHCSQLTAQIAEAEATATRLEGEALDLEMNGRVAQRETTLVEQRACELSEQVIATEQEIRDAKTQLGKIHSTFAGAADSVTRMEYKIRSVGPISGSNEKGKSGVR